MASIKAANNESDSVNIGQVLIIPGNIKTASALTSTKAVSTTSSRATVKPIVSSKVIVHKVVRGDYLGKIAAKYGVTMSSIRQLNHLKSDNVMLGQKLKIAVPAQKYVQHKVKRGEFLSKIADKYGVLFAYSCYDSYVLINGCRTDANHTRS